VVVLADWIEEIVMGKKLKRRATQNSPDMRYLWIAVTVAAVFGIYMVLRGNPSARGTSLEPTLPASASMGPAPGFHLPDIQGKSVSLADFRGKVVILDFWATWCPPCRREIPDFIELQSEYGSKGLQIVGVALDEPAKVKEFAARAGMNYTVLLGNDDVSYRYGGISGIPTTFVIDRKGNIVERFEGFTSKSEFESEIRKLL
jgi:peroxiredoxin